MIYVTLGTMFLDFERLVHAMDAIAEATGERVLMQVGMSKVLPTHCEHFDFKPHDEILALQAKARVIVCHAGIGATIDALHARRPFIVAPRLKRFGEHLNDHQLEIAEAVARRGWGRMVVDMDELAAACADPVPFPEGYRPAREGLLSAVRRMVDKVAEEKGG
jgi:beta-1,4-N-acetylglucosaminyltransferase